MPTVGSQLKAARLARHETLEEVSKATRIRVSYLEALEADDFSRLPSPVQARGFLRLYANHLGLDLAKVIALAQQTQHEEQTLQGPLPSIPPIPSSPPTTPPLSLGEKLIEAARTLWLRLRPQPRAREEAGAVRIEKGRLQVASPEADAASEANRAPIHPPSQASPELPIIPPSPATPPIEHPSILPQSTALFRQLGTDLRKHREELGLRLESIAPEIKIQLPILQALEEGNFDALPIPIITRHHLAKYAEFLTLDVDEVLLRFADVLQARVRERGLPQGSKERHPILPRTLSLTLLLSGDLLFGILVIVALATFALWSINLIAATRSKPVLRTTPIPDVLAQNPVLATFTPTPTEPLSTPKPTLALTPFTLPTQSDNVQVVLIVLERVFLRVIVDGRPVLEERALPGNTYTYNASRSIEILAANAGVIRVFYNGKDLGLLGDFGQTLTRIFTVQGIATPTATLSPTPTVTSTLTSTSTPTPTITPTTSSSPR
ncbi:MAG: RodZ domain-containing protein [Anaerolineales bacterium]